MISLARPIIGAEEIAAVIRVLRSGNLTQGIVVQQLEKRFMELCGTSHAVATNSGTSALHTAIYAAGILPGDEVITTPFTFIATANAVIMSGAQPVFVDIDPTTFNIDASKIEQVVTKRTKAILAVNLFGQPAEYAAIMAIARQYNLIVIEDAAQSINAQYQGKMSGNLAHIGCFSLYATKNIMCGEGGMITTNNAVFAQRARMFRNHGQDEYKRYLYKDLGYNYRLTDILAALGIAQLKRLKKITKKRQSVASYYTTALKDIPGLILPLRLPDRTHVYHQYTLRVTDSFPLSRKKLQEYLFQKGIQSAIYYPQVLSEFTHLGQKSSKKRLSEAYRAADECLSLPIHPFLTLSHIHSISSALTNISI